MNGGLMNSRGRWLSSLVVALVGGSVLASATLTLAADKSLKVMSINIGSAENSSANRNTLAQIIRDSGADIVGIQQLGSTGTGTSGDRLEDMRALLQSTTGVRWYAFRQSQDGIRTTDNASTSADEQILSRYPVLQGVTALNPPTPSAHVLPQHWGAQVEITPGHNVWVMNTRLESYPYQVYDIRDGNLTTEAQVIAEANAARGAQVTDILNSMNAAGVNNGDPVFWTGDFNEPSHLDWTAAATAASARTFDFKIAWPTSTSVVAAGFTDSYRAQYPDPITKPGLTWTTGTAAGALPNYPANNSAATMERIDYVYHRGDNVTLTGSQTIGHAGTVSNPRLIDTDVQLSNYNTDHAAVVSSYTVSELYDSVLTFSKLGANNSGIPQSYGDNLITTPNVQVAYSASGGGTQAATWKFWEAGNWGKGGVAFLDSGDDERVQPTDAPTTYSVLFTPTGGEGVRVKSFELIDYNDNDGFGQNVRWSLVDGSEELYSDIANIADGQRLLIDTGMHGLLYTPLTLRLEHLAGVLPNGQGGSRNDLAIDNIAFSQVAIPEPSTLATLAGVGLLALGYRFRGNSVAR